MLRGAMIATYNFWFGMGGFAAAIGLQIAVTGEGYKNPIYSQFLFIGLMAIAFIIIPESPCEYSLGSAKTGFYLNKDQPEKAKAVLRRIYGGIEGYDVELEYRVLNYERELQLRSAAEAKNASYAEIFRGTNR